MNLKVFILEDEPFGLDRLQKLIHEIDESITILGHAETIKSAVWWFKNNTPPDLIFMDIELSDGQCFEIFNQIELHVPIIFTTSYDEYALQAFKVNSIDYLLKPIRKADLEKALAKFNRITSIGGMSGTLLSNETLDKLLSSLKEQVKKEYRSRFLVKQGQRWMTIESNEIAWFYAEGKICFLKTWENQRFIIDYTLEELEQMLDPALYFRINRSYLVHTKSIQSFQPYFNGKLIVSMSPKPDEPSILISREKAQDFKKWMGK